MIAYKLDETLDQAIRNLATEHQSGFIGYRCIDTTVAVADVILTNGTKAQVHLKITTEEFDFLTEKNKDMPVIDLSA